MLTLKNKYLIILSLLCLILSGEKSFAFGQAPVYEVKKPKTLNEAKSDQKEVQLNIKNENKLQIKVSEPVKQIDGNLFKSKEEMMSQYFQVQKKMDIDDIKTLWSATVERNQVIRFALKKLAMPAEQRRIHSSIMAKTVSTLISGVSLLPGLLGADSITSSASSAAGTLANRAITARELPKEMPLSDTELIHLAKLIQDLQDKMIKDYYDYKSDLESLKIARQEVLKQNIAYSVALKGSDPLAVLTARKLYDNALKDELGLKQRVILHRLDLERLAGSETLDNLTLGKIIISDVKEKQPVVLQPVSNSNLNAYSDKSVRELAQEAGAELKEDKNNMLADLNILWGAAVERNETIRFAILKLSNPDDKEEKRSAVKKILSPLAGVATIVGVGTSDPVTATSTLLGGSMLNSVLTSKYSELNSSLSKVSDADLVLLAQETDNLQQKLVNLYCDYKTALTNLSFTDQVLEKRKQYYESLQKTSPELKTVADVFYQESLADQYKARQDALTARVALEQFVGNEALVSVDKNIQQRLTLKQ